MLRLTLASALLAATALAAQAQALPERIKSAGKIVVATQPNYAPIAFKDPATNQLTGFDIELGEAIGKELGVKIEWQETAFAQIDGGADLLYAERFGVSDAAKEKKVLAIGNVIDTQADYPETVVASALWHFEPTLDKAIAEVKAGTFKADDYGVYSFMKNGGSSLAPLGTFEGKVPDDIKAKVAEKEKAIKDGSFTVEINDAEPKSS